MSGGVLEGGLVVSEENCTVVREFEFDLNSVFGELGAAWGEGVLAEGGEFGVKVGFGGGESVGGGDSSEGVRDIPTGRGSRRFPFFDGRKPLLVLRTWRESAGRVLLAMPSVRQVKASRMDSFARDWRRMRGFQPVMSLAVPVSLDLTVLMRRSGSMMMLGCWGGFGRGAWNLGST